MGYYLLDHPPASRQFYPTRYETESGVVVVHTAESVMDTVGPDTGAEGVAGFISRRNDPGSYHCLVDSDSIVDLVPPHYTAFQVAVDHFNRHSWGISFATAADAWDTVAGWDNAALAQAGHRIAVYALDWAQRVKGDINRAYEVPRWISQGEAQARTAGMVLHGQLQADRSDAWVHHSERATLEARLRLIVRTEIDRVLKPPEHGGKPMLLIVRPGNDELYVVYDGGVMDHGGDSINAYAGVGLYQADTDGWNRYVKQNYRAREIANKDLSQANKYSPNWPALLG